MHDAQGRLQLVQQSGTCAPPRLARGGATAGRCALTLPGTAAAAASAHWMLTPWHLHVLLGWGLLKGQGCLGGHSCFPERLVPCCPIPQQPRAPRQRHVTRPGPCKGGLSGPRVGASSNTYSYKQMRCLLAPFCCAPVCPPATFGCLGQPPPRQSRP